MDKQDASKLLELSEIELVSVVIPIDDSFSDSLFEKLKSMGFSYYTEQTASGPRLVVNRGPKNNEVKDGI